MKYQHHHQCQFSKERTMKKYLLLLLLAASSFTQAATFNVSTTPELRVALSTAAINSEDDIIILAGGTYKTTDDGEGTFIYLSNEANSLTIQGVSKAITIIDGEGLEQIFNFHSIFVDDGTFINIENITFINGYANESGGALYSSIGGSIQSCSFDNNKAVNDGGAIFIESDARITINDSNFSNNEASRGGAVFGYYAFRSSKYSFEIVNTAFIANKSFGDGGAVFSITANIESSAFELNHALGNGGAIYGVHTVNKSTFFKNSSEKNGGAISRAIKVFNSEFRENLAILDGGAIDARGTLREIATSNFLFNKSNNNGGAVSVSNPYGGDIDYLINDVTFQGNIALSAGGGFFGAASNRNYTYNAKVIDSKFLSNRAEGGGGGGFYSRSTDVLNSVFYDNYSADSGGGFYGGGNVVSSIFDGNSSENEGGAFASYPIKLFNSIVKSNSSGVYSTFGTDQNYIVNNIFSENISSDINGSDNTVLNLKNNYIDTSKISVSFFESNSIFTGITLGFVGANTKNYRLLNSSDLIDAGTGCSKGVFELEAIVSCDNLPFDIQMDLDNSFRFSGSNIDIGPYEFSSSKPTINSFSFTGTPKELMELSFVIDYSLAGAGSSLDYVVYDYMNDGNWTSSNIHTYDASGSYTVNVKVADSEGEFSTSSIEIVIEKSSLQDKMLTVITQDVINEVMPFIEADKADAVDFVVASAASVGISSGKQYVQDNLTEFSLVTEAAQATAVASAVSAGIADGENNVINNPVAYGLNIVVRLSKESIAQLPSGWNMISIPEDVTDLSVFDDAKIVWFFNNETQAWAGYSSNSNVMQQMKDKNIDIITKLSAGDGIFIEM